MVLILGFYCFVIAFCLVCYNYKMLRMRFHYNNYYSQLNNFNDVDDGEEDDDDNEEVSSVC